MNSIEVDKISEIRAMIEDSPRFQEEYGKKVQFIKYVLPLMDSVMIDKIYGFLIIEKNINK